MAVSRASVAKHPIHPMLVVFPLGLWITALAFDIVEAATGNPMWRTLAFWNIVAGIIGALVAAIPGLVDYFTLDGRVGRLATWHMVVNLGAVALFVVNAFVRVRVDAASAWPLTLSAVGIIVLIVGGWLGGELVYVERMGVEEPSAAREPRSRRVA